MTGLFEGVDPAPLRMPTRRAEIPGDLLLEVVSAAAAAPPPSTQLRIRILDPLGSDPLLSIEEAERRVRIGIAELARQMELAHVVDTPHGVTTAFRAWLARRPVTDADAAAAGIAVCGWTEPERDRVAWQVVVRRGAMVRPWHPSPLVSPATLAETRRAAEDRSLEVVVDMHPTGDAVVWTCAATPALSTAALVAPERLLQRLSRRGFATDDIRLVLVPPNPFVSAPGPVARRLSEEASGPHVILPWRQLDSLGWS